MQRQARPVTELDRCQTSVKSLGAGLDALTLGPGGALLPAAQGDTVDYPGAPDERGCPRCRHGGRAPDTASLAGAVQRASRDPAAGDSGEGLGGPLRKRDNRKPASRGRSEGRGGADHAALGAMRQAVKVPTSLLLDPLWGLLSSLQGQEGGGQQGGGSR